MQLSTVACLWHVCDVKCNTQGRKKETFTDNESQEESIAHIAYGPKSMHV